jgi:single stranded DNA-binding protein
MNYQKLILVGNTTGAARVEKAEGKTAYADFTVAVNRSREETDFFPVRAFGRLTEGAARIEKGSLVLVEGRVEIDRFAPEGSEPRTTIRVLADSIRLFPRAGQSAATTLEAEEES